MRYDKTIDSPPDGFRISQPGGKHTTAYLLGPDGLVWSTSWTAGGEIIRMRRQLQKAWEIGLLNGADGTRGE